MKLRWTPEAAEDLEQIANYLHREQASYAQGTIIRLSDGIRTLRTHPFSGRIGREPGTRELLYLPLPYMAIYRVEEAAVIVLGFRHLAREYPVQ